jgi:hypothetical protein
VRGALHAEHICPVRREPPRPDASAFAKLAADLERERDLVRGGAHGGARH